MQAKFLVLGRFCRLVDSVVLGIWEGSISALIRLRLGFADRKGMAARSSCKRFLAGTR